MKRFKSAYLASRVVKKNPPRTTRTAKKQRRKPARRVKPAAKASSVVRGTLLGRALTLTYQHARGGRYRHKFTSGAKVGVINDGKTLVITGIDVKNFIE